MENTEGKKSNMAIGSATVFQNSAPKISSDTDKIPNLAGNAENGISTSTVTASVQNQTTAKEAKESKCEKEEMGPHESSSTVDVRKMEKDSLVEQKPIENSIDVTNTMKDIPDKNVNEKKIDSSTILPKVPLSGTGDSVDTHQKDESKSITMEQTKASSAATTEDVVNKSIEKILSAAEMLEKPNSDKSGEVDISTTSPSEAQVDKNKQSDKSGEVEISTASPSEAQGDKDKQSDKSGEVEISTASPSEAQGDKDKQSDKSGEVEISTASPSEAQGDKDKQSDKSGEVEISTTSPSEAQGDKDKHSAPEESDHSEIEKSVDKNEKINNEKNQGTNENDQTIAPNEKKVSDTMNCVSVEAIPVEETNMDEDEEEVVVVAEVVPEECEAMVPEKRNFESSQVEKVTNEPMDVDTPVESDIPSKEKEVAASSNATTVSNAEKVKDTSLSTDKMLIDKVDKGSLTEPETNVTKTATEKSASNLAPEAEESGEKSAMDMPATEQTKSTKEKTLEVQPNEYAKDKPPSSSGGSSKPIETQAEEESNQAKTKTQKLSEDSEKSKASKKPMKLTIEQKKRLNDARTRLINSKTYWRQIEVDDARLVGWEAHECLREDKKHIDRYWLTCTGFRLRSRPEIERFLSYMGIMNDSEDEAFALLKGKKVSGKKASPKKAPAKKAPPKKTSPRKTIAASSKKASSETKKQSPKVPTKKPNNKMADISVPVKSSLKRKKDETTKERNSKKAKTKKSRTTSHEVVEMTTAVNQTLMRRLARGTQKVEVAEQKSIPSFRMHREYSKKKAAKTSAPRVTQQKSHKSGLPNLADGKE
ncbi:predicted protein [Chaetoceros tenuissimus]|uniref:MBD domain-containing protein n=1 Tax=Chaetoceros tenuissimus TaxID=426638 RepID=A0AAD3H924_9STRA|nr:predicted protein [Chaetoceros tenuissimus]